ncbi:hypothetical protein M9458_050860 [Cirrhinus mrigala]|uniref:non-specific serine/threonine protein kinase n=1 Tax=Cirrhinus mrigala TaxID=683832 RepID=A0ABD0MUZ5_CIRMR
MCPTSVSVPEGGVHETEAAAWLDNISFCNGFCQWVDDEEWSVDSLPADSQQPVESNRASEAAVNEQPSADKSPTEISTQGNRRSRIHAFFKRAWKAVKKPFLRCRWTRVESPPPRQSDLDPEPGPVPGPSELQNEPHTDPAVPEPSVPDLPDYKPTTSCEQKNAEMEQPLYSSNSRLFQTSAYRSGAAAHVEASSSLPLRHRNLVVAVQHCIDRGVFHNDVHANNILVNTNTLELKLIDFGSGHLLDSDGYDSLKYIGALQFCPPEVYSRPKYYGVPTNVWALGITLYMMVNMRLPFSSVREILQASIYTWKADVSMSCCDLIYQCLDRSPVKRPTFEQILQHKWFESQASE